MVNYKPPVIQTTEYDKEVKKTTEVGRRFIHREYGIPIVSCVVQFQRVLVIGQHISHLDYFDYLMALGFAAGHFEHNVFGFLILDIE